MKRYLIEVSEYDGEDPKPRLVDSVSVRISDHLSAPGHVVEELTAGELRSGMNAILDMRAKRAEDAE